MKPKYWAIIILATLAICVGVIYYINQPAPDLGQISFRHGFINQTTSGCPAMTQPIVNIPLDTVVIFVKPGVSQGQVTEMSNKYLIKQTYFNTINEYSFSVKAKSLQEILTLINKLSAEPIVRMATPGPFSTPVDQSKVVHDYPVDQLLMTLNVNSTWQDAQIIAQSVCGKIGGFTPSINLYQVLLPTSSTKQLNDVKATLQNYPQVVNVMENFIGGNLN